MPIICSEGPQDTNSEALVSLFFFSIIFSLGRKKEILWCLIDFIKTFKTFNPKKFIHTLVKSSKMYLWLWIVLPDCSCSECLDRQVMFTCLSSHLPL